jgi:hypothetical protein
MPKITFEYNVLMTVICIGIQWLTALVFGSDSKLEGGLFGKTVGDRNPFFVIGVLIIVVPLLVYFHMHVIRSLWNRLVSPITGFTQIDLYQAYAINLLIFTVQG